MELRQGLPPRGIGCPVEEHLDLRVITICRIVRHPVARLEMEILQIVAGPLSARPLAQNFAVRVSSRGADGFREDPRRKAASGEAVSTAIHHDRREAGKCRPRHWRGPAGEGWPYPRRGVCGPARLHWCGLAAALSYHLVAAPPLIAGVRQGCARLPSDTRQLAGAISDACSKAGERIAHASLPETSRATNSIGRDKLNTLRLATVSALDPSGAVIPSDPASAFSVWRDHSIATAGSCRCDGCKRRRLLGSDPFRWNRSPTVRVRMLAALPADDADPIGQPWLQTHHGSAYHTWHIGRLQTDATP